MDGAKTRTSGGKTFVQGSNFPTQAKIGLEWATRRLSHQSSVHNGNSVLHPSIRSKFRKIAKLCIFVPIACGHVNSFSFSRQSRCIVFGLCLKFNQEMVCPF